MGSNRINLANSQQELNATAFKAVYLIKISINQCFLLGQLIRTVLNYEEVIICHQ